MHSHVDNHLLLLTEELLAIAKDKQWQRQVETNSRVKERLEQIIGSALSTFSLVFFDFCFAKRTISVVFLTCLSIDNYPG
jgi:hypothetical protein